MVYVPFCLRVLITGVGRVGEIFLGSIGVCVSLFGVLVNWFVFSPFFVRY